MLSVALLPVFFDVDLAHIIFNENTADIFNENTADPTLQLLCGEFFGIRTVTCCQLQCIGNDVSDCHPIILTVCSCYHLSQMLFV